MTTLERIAIALAVIDVLMSAVGLLTSINDPAGETACGCFAVLFIIGALVLLAASVFALRN